MCQNGLPSWRVHFNSRIEDFLKTTNFLFFVLAKSLTIAVDLDHRQSRVHLSCFSVLKIGCTFSIQCVAWDNCTFCDIPTRLINMLILSYVCSLPAQAVVLTPKGSWKRHRGRNCNTGFGWSHCTTLSGWGWEHLLEWFSACVHWSVCVINKGSDGQRTFYKASIIETSLSQWSAGDCHHNAPIWYMHLVDNPTSS